MRLAVLGDPIEHSRSPRIHAAAAATLGLDWSYGRVRLTEAEAEPWLDARDATWLGLSVTAPLKGVAAGWARERDAIVAATGAANTLLVDGRRAWNTDVAGIVDAFAAAGVQGVASGGIVGGGATAVSALVALADMGAARVDVWMRSPERGARLAALGDELGVDVRIGGPDTVVHGDAVVSTLPASAAAAPRLAGARAVLDADYASGTSRYADDAPVVPGIEMLLGQALRQVRIFVGGDPESRLDREDEVRRAMREAAGAGPSPTLAPPRRA